MGRSERISIHGKTGNGAASIRYLSLFKTGQIIFFLLFAGCSFAQYSQIDSLRKILNKGQDDKTEVKILNKLSDLLETIGNYDSSLICASRANGLAENTGYKRGQSEALRNIGIIYDDEGNYPQALDYHLKALKINEELNDIDGIAHNYVNIGNTYLLQENYAKALDYDLMALARYEETRNDKGRASVLSNIGSIYYNRENVARALEYMMKALPIFQKLDDKNGIAATLGNIGLAYLQKGDYPQALDYTFKALELNRQIDNSNAIAENYSNLGLIYSQQNKNNTIAVNYNLNALAIYRKLGDKSGMCNSLGNIGNVYCKESNFRLSRVYLDSALNLAKQVGDIQLIQLTYSALSNLDSTEGDFRAALQDYKTEVSYKDSLVNEANTKRIVQTEMTFDFQHKQDSVASEQVKKDLLADQDKKKQAIIRNFFMGGFVLTLALAFFIFRGYRQKQNDNITITRQKEEVEKQKTLVDEKNKNILDSINYAKRIQSALLKDEERVSLHLPDHFILFKPKDIVSGDFYWALEADNYFYFAAVDCTGHGVPGAFMSMLGVAFLNEITSGAEILTPAQILDKLRVKIVKELGQGKDQENKDGMDISLLRMNLKTREIQWSGANNPLYIVNTVEEDLTAALQEITPDKQPIGYFPVMKPFTNHIADIKKGSICYLFSDGFADQFGGAKGKKFKYARLKDELLAIRLKPLAEQKILLNEAFEKWKGALEQVDDVLIIGIRV